MPKLDPPTRAPASPGPPDTAEAPTGFISLPVGGRPADASAPPAAPAAEGEVAAPVAPPPRRRRRWPWWVLRGLLLALILPGAVLAVTLVVTPSVSDAPARVAAMDAARHSVPVEVRPSWKVAQAVVAAEDSSFYSNHGVDLLGAARALWGRVIGRDLGGSTISEQLAKVVYEQGRTSFPDRLSEVALALKLRGHYSAEAVLSMYLSAVYYGHGYVGVMAASQGYFGLPPDRLSWGQAAMLAGLPQSPSTLDPLRHLAAARARQAYVLDQLVDTGALTPAQARAAAAQPLGLR